MSEGWRGTGPPPRQPPRGTDTGRSCRDSDCPHRRYGAGRTQRPPDAGPRGSEGDSPQAEPRRSPCPAVPGVPASVPRVGAQRRVRGLKPHRPSWCCPHQATLGTWSSMSHPHRPWRPPQPPTQHPALWGGPRDGPSALTGDTGVRDAPSLQRPQRCPHVPPSHSQVHVGLTPRTHGGFPKSHCGLHPPAPHPVLPPGTAGPLHIPVRCPHDRAG